MTRGVVSDIGHWTLWDRDREGEVMRSQRQAKAEPGGFLEERSCSSNLGLLKKLLSFRSVPGANHTSISGLNTSLLPIPPTTPRPDLGLTLPPGFSPSLPSPFHSLPLDY